MGFRIRVNPASRRTANDGAGGRGAVVGPGSDAESRVAAGVQVIFVDSSEQAPSRQPRRRLHLKLHLNLSYRDDGPARASASESRANRRSREGREGR